MRELVILDLDNVVVDGQSQKILLSYLLRNRKISSFYYLKICLWFIFYKLGIFKNPQKIMEYAFGFLKDQIVIEIEEIVDDFFKGVLKKFIFKEMIDIINKHKEENREILIISNTLEIIVKKVARFLGVQNYIGTRLEILNGKFTGNILGHIVYGRNKKRALQHFIERNKMMPYRIWAYGDHISDLDILMSATNPIVVNPDRGLYREAIERNWQILFFHR